MRCRLIIDEELIEETTNYFKSIGMSWIKPEDLDSDKIIDIGFVYIPDILKIYSMEMTPCICSISALGVSFYLSIEPKSVLVFEDGSMEGSVFCPMSNITYIDFSSHCSYKNLSSKQSHS